VSATVPDQVPAQLIAGDTWAWTRDLSDYPAGTWTVVYYFENKDGTFSANASASGTTHSVSISATTTAGYTSGRYRWRARASSGGNSYVVESGFVDVLFDPAASGKRDVRTHARRVLEAIEATIEGRASNDQLAMTINGRSISRTPIAELLVARDKYKGEVASQDSAERVASGLGSKRRTYVRFGRA
jgi:hypothetical protein